MSSYLDKLIYYALALLLPVKWFSSELAAAATRTPSPLTRSTSYSHPSVHFFVRSIVRSLPKREKSKENGASGFSLEKERKRSRKRKVKNNFPSFPLVNWYPMFLALFIHAKGKTGKSFLFPAQDPLKIGYSSA